MARLISSPLPASLVPAKENLRQVEMRFRMIAAEAISRLELHVALS